MNFILLAQGGIVENFLSDVAFLGEIFRTHRLVGVIGSDVVIDKLKNISRLDCKDYFLITEKSENENNLMDLILRKNPDYILSIQYPWIISSALLGMSNRRFFNLHNAKLPEYRGHNSLSHVILNEEKYHTITVHRMAAVVDRGHVLMTNEIPVYAHDTAHSLWSRSVASAKDLLLRWFQDIDSVDKIPEGRKMVGVDRYYPRDVEEFKKIPYEASMPDIEKYARAFYFPPHLPAYFEVQGRRVYVTPGEI